MKIKTLIAALFLSTGMLMAQDFSIKYAIKMSSSDPEVKAQLGMLQNSTLEVLAAGNKSRTAMSMGGLMTTTTIIDADKGKGLMLLDGMMGRQAAKMDEIPAIEADESDIEIELIDETKKILGYECKKAVIYGEDGTELIYWYTEKVKLKEGVLAQYVNNGVPGLPLQFVIQQPQITMEFTASEFTEKVGKTKGQFDLSIPKDYKEVSIDDMKNIGGM